MNIKNINRVSDTLNIALGVGLIALFSQDIKNVLDYSKDKNIYEKNTNALGDRVYTPKTIEKDGRVSTLYNFASNIPTNHKDQEKKMKEAIGKIMKEIDHERVGKSSSEFLGLGKDHHILDFSQVKVNTIIGHSSDEYENNGIGKENKENNTLAIERANQFHKSLKEYINKNNLLGDIRIQKIEIKGVEDLLEKSEIEELIDYTHKQYPNLTPESAIIKSIEDYNTGKSQRKDNILDSLLKEKRSVEVHFTYFDPIDGNKKAYIFPTRLVQGSIIMYVILFLLISYSREKIIKSKIKKDSKK